MLKRVKLSFLLSLVLLASCSEYNKVLNKGTAEERYTMANDLYKEKSFRKSNRMFELVLPAFEAKPQKEVIVYRLADGSFNDKDYTTAIYYYEKLIRSFPKSTKIEFAQYQIAESYYKLSPKYSVDQTDTKKAIESFQSFIDKNPNSEKIETANARIKELNYKLETKSFEIAKQYLKIGQYSSAMVAFDNVILDFLGTSYKEQALFFKFKAAYELAINSIAFKKQDRTDEAIKVYTKYKKIFPESEYLKEADKMYANLLGETSAKTTTK